ncbi:class I SAM-dependent methyltransferase [Ascidiimonas aurantiaca]|uniref:O-methyltransferase n=1 Tax=Ascidiimonas aurantiaca TaxID=1685432 RepID=UPI0030EB93DB
MVRAYFRYLFRSVNQHGIHSPFVYDLVTRCFYNSTPHTSYNTINQYRKKLLKDKSTILITDFGAGSRVFTSQKRKVTQIARTAGISLRNAYLLNRIIRYFNVRTVLELGTSLGIGSCAMASAHDQCFVTTVEGCSKTAQVAQNTLDAYKIYNCKVVNSTFDAFLDSLTNEKFDLIYIDGHHSKQPTLRYFEKLIAHTGKNSLLIFDDIHWSSDMESAWNTIKTHSKVTLTIDIFSLGLVFFKEVKAKQHFTVRF